MDKSSDIVIVKKTSVESQAIIYQARLDEAGIPSFVSNQNMNTVFPVAGGIGLHVHQINKEKALEIIHQVDQMSLEDNSVFTHHEATLDDIRYEELISKSANKTQPYLLWLAGILILLFLVRFVAKSLGLFPHFFDSV